MAASGWGTGYNNGSTTAYKVPAYLVQSGDTVTAIIENFYNDTSVNQCIVNALTAFNAGNGTALDCNGNLYAGYWILLPTSLYDGTTQYDFQCGLWEPNPVATGLTGVTGSCALSCAGFATVGDTCGAGTV